MLFYISLLLFSSITSFCYSFSKDVYIAKIFKSTTFLILLIPLVLRYGIGTDYFQYGIMFNDIARGQQERTEPGYQFLNHTVYRFGGDVQIVIALMGFFTQFFFFKAFPKKYFYLFVPLFVMTVYLWTYTTIRQIFVVSLAWYAYDVFFLKKKYVKFLLLILFGALFHFSSIIYLFIIVIFPFIKINRNTAMIIFLFILLSYNYAHLITNLFFELIVSKTPFAHYYGITRWWENATLSSGLGVLVRFITYFVMLLPCINDNKKEENKTLLLFLISIFFDLLSMKIFIFTRISRGLLFSYFLMIKEIKTGKSRYRSVFLIIIYFLILIYFIGVLQSNNSVPYRSIFQKY
jgi:hypothetical protein